MDKTSVSKINSILTKHYLQNQIENQYFERKGLKEKQLNPSKIANEIIGMLNADGGILAFGISDDGSINDLSTLGEKELNRYRRLAFDLIEPSCNVEVEEIELENKLIFLYHVDHDIERLFHRKDNEHVFLRVLDENRKLNLEQIKKLEYDKLIRKFEEEIISNFDKNDLDIELLEDYKNKLNYQGDVIELLSKRHLVLKKDGKYHFKNSAALLFSKDPEKYIPSASVRYIRYDGTEALTGVAHNVIKDQRFENNIPRLIDEIKLFLRTSLKEFYFLDIESGKFNHVMEYPEEAWLEGIVNALCHRSYNIQGSAMYIKHFDNRLEISNSGPLPAQVTIENIKTERYSRNPRVARVLEDLGYVRQLNEGVARIYESMEKSMLSTPEYKEINNNIYLTLRNKISNHSKTVEEQVLLHIENNWKRYNDTQQKIISTLFYKPESTIIEISEFVGINNNTVRTYLNGFIEEGFLERKSKKIRDINAKYAFKKRK